MSWSRHILMEVVLSHSRRVGGVALAFAAVAMFTAGCGSNGGSAAPTTVATDYLTCLRDNGVNLPQMNGSGRPDGNPSGRPSRNPSTRPSAGADGGPGTGGFPGGGGGLFGSQAPTGVDQQTWDKAQQACGSLRPSGNPNGGGRNNGATAAYRNCLSDHGVTVSGPIEQLDSKDTKVAPALEACAALRPSPRASN
jgi:hypothetical protein